MKVPFNADPAEEAVWLHVGGLLDAPARRITGPCHLVFDDVRILHADAAPPPADIVGSSKPVELPANFALPPFFDAHTHVNLRGSEREVARRTAEQGLPPGQLLDAARARARAALAHGIIGMRDGGDKDGVGLALASTSRSIPESTGLPAILSPGPGIHRKGRYGSFFSEPVENFSSMRECAGDRVWHGANHLKIVPTGIINFAKGAVTAPPQFTAAEIAACAAVAAEHGIQLMAHASGAEGIENAITGGVSTIEHGYFITRDQLARMRDLDIAWVPTFAPVHVQIACADILGWDAAIVDALRRILDGHADSLRYALEIGVTLLAGSDAGSYGVPHAAGLIDELRLLHHAGMPSLDALVLACHTNATRLAPAIPTRTLAPGTLPTFLLAPLEAANRPALLSESIFVFGGQCLPADPEIDSML